MGRGRGTAELAAVTLSKGTRELVKCGYRFEAMLSQERGDCYLNCYLSRTNSFKASILLPRVCKSGAPLGDGGMGAKSSTSQ